MSESTQTPKQKALSHLEDIITSAKARNAALLTCLNGTNQQYGCAELTNQLVAIDTAIRNNENLIVSVSFEMIELDKSRS